MFTSSEWGLTDTLILNKKDMNSNVWSAQAKRACADSNEFQSTILLANLCTISYYVLYLQE